MLHCYEFVYTHKHTQKITEIIHNPKLAMGLYMTLNDLIMKKQAKILIRKIIKLSLKRTLVLRFK